MNKRTAGTMNIFPIIYSSLLSVWATLALPKMLWDYTFKKKYRQSLGMRFGINYPAIEKNGTRFIWIHAVSVGETRAVRRLVQAIKQEHPQAQIIISSITETGHEEAKRSIPEATQHVYFPLDFRWIIKRVLKDATPDIVIVCETDFWWNFLDYTKSKGAKIALVNGKMSARSASRLKTFSFYSKRLFSLFDCLCVQNTKYREAFIQAGAAPERTVVTGNLKFDENPQKLSEEDLSNFRNRLRIKENAQVITIGSSHDPEEKILLDALKPLWEQFPHLVLLIVPRHPERFNDVANLLKIHGYTFGRLSQPEALLQDNQVILVDSMGLLRSCYQISDIAIVAGSYVERVGGHNILEPLFYDVPLIYGPYMHSQPDFAKAVKEYDAGLQLELPELSEKITKLLRDAHYNAHFVQNAKKMLEESKSSTERTLNDLKVLGVL